MQKWRVSSLWNDHAWLADSWITHWLLTHHDRLAHWLTHSWLHSWLHHTWLAHAWLHTWRRLHHAWLHTWLHTWLHALWGETLHRLTVGSHLWVSLWRHSLRTKARLHSLRHWLVTWLHTYRLVHKWLTSESLRRIDSQ